MPLSSVSLSCSRGLDVPAVPLLIGSLMKNKRSFHLHGNYFPVSRPFVGTQLTGDFSGMAFSLFSFAFVRALRYLGLDQRVPVHYLYREK